MTKTPLPTEVEAVLLSLQAAVKGGAMTATETVRFMERSVTLTLSFCHERGVWRGLDWVVCRGEGKTPKGAIGGLRRALEFEVNEEANPRPVKSFSEIAAAGEYRELARREKLNRQFHGRLHNPLMEAHQA